MRLYRDSCIILLIVDQNGPMRAIDCICVGLIDDCDGVTIYLGEGWWCVSLLRNRLWFTNSLFFTRTGFIQHNGKLLIW